MSAPGRTEAAVQAINACEELTEDERVSARVLVALNINVAPVIAATPPEEHAKTIRRLLDQTAHTTAGAVSSSSTPDYDPAWMSLFLALSSNISEYVPTDGIVPHPPASDNLLRLQRAVTAAWPPHLPPPFLFGNSSFGSRLYRQPSYHRLRQELPLAKSDRVGGGHSVMAAKGVLISGNAGTGKSNFLLDHAHALLRPVMGFRPTVMYFNYSYNKFCRIRGSGGASPAPPITPADITFATAANAETAFRLDLADPQAHLLIDLGGADAPAGSSLVLPVCAANVVAVASPAACNADPVRAWATKMAGLVSRYLPVASRQVLEECRRLTSPTTEEAAADAHLADADPRKLLPGETYRGNSVIEVFNKRAERYGCILRSCFDTDDTELRDRLAQVFASCSLHDIVKGTADGKLDRLHKFSSMLLHYRVFDSSPLTAVDRQAVHLAQMAQEDLISDVMTKAAALAAIRPPTLPFCLLSPPLQFASEWMKDQLYAKYQTEHQHEVSKFLHDCLENPALFSVRHDFFESHAHAIMRRGGITLYTHQLDPTNGGRMGVLTRTTFNATGATLPINSLADFAHLAPDQYGRPVRSNWPTLDAVLEPNITLQYTTSDSHSVVEGGLHDAEFHLHTLATHTGRGGGAFRLRHYFGVPPDRFNSFSLRPTDFTITPGKPKPANVDYFVVMVEDPEVTSVRQRKRGASAASSAGPARQYRKCGPGSSCKRCPCKSAGLQCDRQTPAGCACTAKCTND